MKYTLLTLALFSFFLPVYVSAQELNAGFVQGLWYSEKEVFADEPVRIYAALRNNTEYDLTGVVRFTDDGEAIGQKEVSALPGRLVEAWTDWTPDYGEHTVEAELVNIRLHTVGEPPEVADVTSTLAEDLLFVDYDTDGDGIGNEKDDDDDGDGIPDREEEANDTDPLDPNDPPATRSEDRSSDSEAGTPADTSDSSNSARGDAGDSRGLERFLTESRAENALSSVTNTINTAKRSLDEYRASRNTPSDEDEANETARTDETATSTMEGTSTEDTATITRSRSDPPQTGFAGFLKGLVSFLGSLLDALYTFTLFLFSVYLGHPAFVQFTLLILILFLVYKLARRMGQRPG